VIKPTVIASITSVFALYFAVLGCHSTSSWWCGRVVVLTFINWLGVKVARTQSLFTTAR
jgi:hypothetical protein